MLFHLPCLLFVRVTVSIFERPRCHSETHRAALLSCYGGKDIVVCAIRKQDVELFFNEKK